MATDRLSREASPPAGQPACPEPQYKNVTSNEYEALKGRDGATFTEVSKRAITATPTCTTVSVGTTHTALPAVNLSGRHTVWITNPSTTVSVYICDASENIGFEITPKMSFPLLLYSDAVIVYAKVASGTQDVYVMELK